MGSRPPVTGRGRLEETRHGSRNWITDLLMIIGGGIGFGLWVHRVPYQIARRRLRQGAFII